jgi:hypothetical protein
VAAGIANERDLRAKGNRNGWQQPLPAVLRSTFYSV